METTLTDAILLEESRDKVVFIWGTGAMGRRFALRLSFLGVFVSGFITSKKYPRTSSLELPVLYPEEVMASAQQAQAQAQGPRVGVIFLGSSLRDEISYEFKRVGLHSFFKLFDVYDFIDLVYGEWYEKYREDRLKRICLSKKGYSRGPSFSVVVPLFFPKLDELRACVRSIASQVYPAREVIFVIDGPHSEEVAIGQIIRSELQDPIILQLAKHTGISNALNSGVSKSASDFICFVDQDDVIEPDALEFYRRAANDAPAVQVMYCDEDKLGADSNLKAPFFKPAFDPILLAQQNYVCHLLCIRRTTLIGIGGFEPRWDFLQDHEWLLRFSRLMPNANVIHVPEILYHWRESNTSTALDISNKPEVALKLTELTKHHLCHHSPGAAITTAEGPSDQSTTGSLSEGSTETKSVSIVISVSSSEQLLKSCLASVSKLTYQNIRECVVLFTEGQKVLAQSSVDAFGTSVALRWVEVSNSCSVSAQIDLGIRCSESELVLLIPGDARFSSSTLNAITDLVALVHTYNLSAANSKVLYNESGLIHSFGDPIIDRNVSKYIGFNDLHHVGYFNELRHNRLCKFLNIVGLLIRKSNYLGVGGLSKHTSTSRAVFELSQRIRGSGGQIAQCHSSILIYKRFFNRNRNKLLDYLSTGDTFPMRTDLSVQQMYPQSSFLRCVRDRYRLQRHQ